jgi:hypothetical protein
MKSLKKYLRRHSAVREEIESWPDKEQEFVAFVYGLLKNIEAIDFVPFVLGMVPFALVYQGLKNGIIPMPDIPVGKYGGLWSFGCIFLSYIGTVIVVNKLAVKKLQQKWIAELYQKMAADKDIAEVYDKLEQIDPYPDWRIRNTFLRLNKLF